MGSSKIKIHPFFEQEQEMEKQKISREESGHLALDIYETSQELVILAPIAGVKAENINLTITAEVLVIKGERKNRETVAEEKYYTKECFWGNFIRSIVLPPEADTQNISANFEDCVLEIRIPRKEINQTRVIKILTAD